ncbi:uncharacterized protein [Rutidosis leptorrhynchoides]|uniref:uncharacterized protein n=1 Tax=Rutidosis leptorrhynchoides TaxID=125765 RepID=UPI003A99C64B
MLLVFNLPSSLSGKWIMFKDRLKNVKLALKEWSTKTFGNLNNEINCLKLKAEEREKRAETDALNDNERSMWMEARRGWLEKEKVKENMLKQKARTRWILEGDENSKFFHSSIKRKYNKCNIRGLNIDGSWNENLVEVKATMFAYFQSVFGSRNSNRRKLRIESEASELELPFSEDEIWDAVKECGSKKAPGRWI